MKGKKKRVARKKGIPKEKGVRGEIPRGKSGESFFTYAKKEEA